MAVFDSCVPVGDIPMTRQLLCCCGALLCAAGATGPEVLAAAAAFLCAELLQAQLIPAPGCQSSHATDTRTAYRAAWRCHFRTTARKKSSSNSSNSKESYTSPARAAAAAAVGCQGMVAQLGATSDVMLTGTRSRQEGDASGATVSASAAGSDGGCEWLMVRCADVLAYGATARPATSEGSEQPTSRSAAAGGVTAAGAASDSGGERSRSRTGIFQEEYPWVLLLREGGGSCVESSGVLESEEAAGRIETLMVMGCREEDVLGVGGGWTATGAALLRARLVAASAAS